jgi:hypothetical protein
MCNCSNFDGGVDRHANEFVDNEDISFDNFGTSGDNGDNSFLNIGDDVEFEDDDYVDVGDESHHNAYGDIDDLDADDDDYDNYSHLHEEDEDIDMDEGGIRQYRADGEIDYDDDGMEDALQQAIAEKEYSSADGLDYGSDFDDEDFEGGSGYENIGSESHAFDGDAEEGDGEFDDFLTKRARARRKLRKKYRKSGMSRKEARKKAVSTIPKQKLGSLLKNAIQGKTSPETKKLLKDLENKGVIDTKKDGLDKVAEQIQNAVNENEVEGTQAGGDTTPSGLPTGQTGGGDVAQAGGTKKGKMGKLIMIGVAVAVLGFVGYKVFSNK